MATSELITVIIVFFIAVLLLSLSIRSFLQRGFLLNNAYIYASKEECETMDKKPYYKQSAVVLCVSSLVFLVMGISITLQNDKIILFEIPLIIGEIVYAIVSTMQINKQARR